MIHYDTKITINKKRESPIIKIKHIVEFDTVEDTERYLESVRDNGGDTRLTDVLSDKMVKELVKKAKKQ